MATYTERREFAAKLKAWRRRENLSQSEAATVLKPFGVTLDSLQNWEAARSMPRGSGYVTVSRIVNGEFEPRVTPPIKIKAALKILRVLQRYAEDNNLEPVAKQVGEVVRLLK
jgi:hypothetical protein